jgi:hypothetical protein
MRCARTVSLAESSVLTSRWLLAACRGCSQRDSSVQRRATERKQASEASGTHCAVQSGVRSYEKLSPPPALPNCTSEWNTPQLYNAVSLQRTVQQ